MKFRAGVGLVCLVPLVLAGRVQGDEPPETKVFRAGAVAIDVSPKTLPVIVNGGFLEKRTDKVNDAPHARCLVLDDGKTRIAIVVVDSCMVPRDLLDRAKGLASKATGIPVERMLISATHTHSAPSSMGALGSAADEDYVAFLPGKIAEGIEKAVAALTPAKIGWGVIDAVDQTHCRRWIRRPDRIIKDPFGDLTVRANMHPGFQNPDTIGPSGPSDPGLSIVSVQSLDGKPLALLANFSMHYVGASPVSADYYGRFAERIKTLLGGDDGFVGIMSQGTSGDQQWMDYGAPTQKTDIDTYADTMAHLALDTCKGIKYQSWVPLTMAERTLTLRRRVPDEKRLAWARPIVEAMGDRPPKDQQEVYAFEAVDLHEHPERELKLQALQIGDLGIAAIPDEVYALTGLKIKARSPLESTFTIELANGSEGYIPPPEQHVLGGYTTWPARTAGLEVQAEPKIVEVVLSLLEQVSGRPRRTPDAANGPYAQAVLQAKPLAYWRLSEMDGSTANDETGQGHEANYRDGIAFALEGPQSPGFSGPGVVNRSAHLAGGWLSAKLPAPGADYSVELWFWNGLPNDARDVTGNLVALGNFALGIGGKSGSQGRLFVSNAEADPVLTGKTELAPKTWHHVALVCAGKTVTVYLDGRTDPEIKGELDREPSDADPEVFIGGRGDGAFSFEGKIDEVAVYDRSLAANDAAAHVKAAGFLLGQSSETIPLPGTTALTWTDDIASRMITGIDRYLLRKNEESAKGRAKFWKRDLTSAETYNASIEPNRKRLAHILGVRDPRVKPATLEIVNPAGITDQLASMTTGSEGTTIYQVRWPAFGDVSGEGLMLEPDRFKLKDRLWNGSVIVLPDADLTPEAVAGLTEGIPPPFRVARRLAESGFRVIVPTLIDRSIKPRNGRAQLTNREYLQRSAYELGRTLAGYEVQKVLALVDWMEREENAFGRQGRIGVFGSGEGGLIALYASAIDPRIKAVCVSGAFDDRLATWREPVDRNVFGLLEQFGGAELAAMVAPRPLIVEASSWPEVTIPGGLGGAPGRLATPSLADVRAEIDRARGLVKGLTPSAQINLIVSGDDGHGPSGSEPALSAFISTLAPDAKLADPAPQAKSLNDDAKDLARLIDARQARQGHEIDRHNQGLLVESPYVRQEFMAKLNLKSNDEFKVSAEWYRDYFRDEVIGRFDEPVLPPNVRSRKVYDEPMYRGYEVVMDVFPDVFAYGVLLVPKNLKDGEHRPVVVCQHGLEGRPQDVADPKGHNPAYSQFAIQLAERGFVTFSPQNPYIFHDRFRTLQRKANPLKKTLFSIIVPQHQQMVNWLKTLPFVDPQRIAFYGLSYGGKAAMRIPPLVQDYCLSICSADFNDWIGKNVSTTAPHSYVWTDEYEIFEFDLGNTFN
ncbi:MAG: LamG-like jellyroll fold domain-containing protein, partial [Isosphaeraceae bacterium]